MQDKDPLAELLQTWETPLPPPDFEVSVVRRLHSTPAKSTFWQRWFVEPWEVAGWFWRTQAIVVTGVAALALALAVGWNLKYSRSAAADFGLDSFSTFPGGSFTQSYLEMMRQ